MQPTNVDNIVAIVTGPKGDPGDATSADIAAAIAALEAGVTTAGNNLAKLYALILARATLTSEADFTVSPTVPTLAPGNNSTKVTNSAYVRQEIINYALALTGGTLSGALILAADPTTALGAATKQYVDAFIQGISNKYSAFCGTAAALAANTYNNGASGVGATLTANANGALAVDGQSPAAGVLVLVKNEVAGANNGLYKVTQAGDSTHPWILTRAVDDDTAAEMAGAFCFVELGTVNNKTGWLCGQATITVGTTAIVFTQFSGAGTYTAGTALSLTGSVFAVSDAELLALAGLVSAADSLPYFTGSGTASLATFTALARTLLAGATAASMRATLGFAAATNGQIFVGQTGSDPAPETVTGDATLSASGVVTLATVNSNVGAFGSATQSVQVTFNAKGLVTAASNVTITPAVGSITGLGTSVGAALAIAVGTAGGPVVLNGAIGSPSSAGTLPAFTMGGTISGGGNQINNVVIGNSTPLAGSFTTMTATGVTANTGGTSPIKLGRALQTSGDTATNYGAISFNTSFNYNSNAGASGAFMLGVMGGATGDPSIGYLSAPSGWHYYLGGVDSYGITSASFFPTTSGVGSLGDASHLFNGVFTTTLTTSGAAVIGGTLSNLQGTVTLANGLNSNVSRPASSWVILSGPTGAFSLGGLTGGTDGALATVFNTVAQTMTIVNEDASSTAGNRITTGTGGNVVLRTTAISIATFRWHSGTSRWILISSN